MRDVMDSLKYLMIVLTLSALMCFASGNREKCITPTYKDGLCVPILQCKSLISLLPNATVNSADIGYLRDSRCGDLKGDFRKVQVCCPIDVLGKDPISQSNGLLPALNVCGLQRNNDIFAGNQTAIDDFPWTVQLIYNNSDNQRVSICAGSLINENYVLTAVHCVDELRLGAINMKLVSVRLGEWDSSKDQDCQCACKSCDCECAEPIVNIDVAEVIKHENYSSASATRENDIALVRLSRGVSSFTKFIRPICLPYDSVSKLNIADQNENITVVTGWGYKEGDVKSDIKSRRAVSLNDGCTMLQGSVIRSMNINPRQQFCAGGLGSLDTCTGEIGSPLMKFDSVTNNWRLIGIFSKGVLDCNGTGTPGVYTRVSQYTDWIVDILINDFTLSMLE